jgi:hypothetical protein
LAAPEGFVVPSGVFLRLAAFLFKSFEAFTKFEYSGNADALLLVAQLNSHISKECQ